MKKVVLTVVAVLLLQAVGAIIVVYSGWYNVAATAQHTRPVYWLLQQTMSNSADRRSEHVEVPPLTDPAMLARGLVLYQTHCARCHGAPGIAPDPFALGLVPLPVNLAFVAQDTSAAKLYWLVRKGIKATGMPAWEFRLAESELWAVVAFVKTLPTLSPAEYAERLRAAGEPASAPQTHDTPVIGIGDPERGRVALHQYACATCHTIPGVVSGFPKVGPPLKRFASRIFIAGLLPNTPENLRRWIRAPQEVSPGNAMPDLGVTERDARDMAAYLYSLQEGR